MRHVVKNGLIPVVTVMSIVGRGIVQIIVVLGITGAFRRRGSCAGR